MEKKFNLSLILPIIYFLLGIQGIISYLNRWQHLIVLFDKRISPFVMLAVGIISFILIKKYDLHIGKYLLFHLTIFSPIMIIVINTVVSKNARHIVNGIFVVLMLLAVIVLAHVFIKDFKTRLVVIIANPMTYFIAVLFDLIINDLSIW